MTKNALNGVHVHPHNVLLSSPGMHEMADRIAEILGNGSFSRCKMEYTTFANKEVMAEIMDTVRGEYVFFLHPLQEPDPNTEFMKMLIACDALKRASVIGITLVVPYIPYLRQDRKHKSRVPITARLIADLIETNSKVERVITLDMHADQEQGFFSIPVDNLFGMVVHAEYFATLFGNDFSNVSVVAPDYGSSVRARRFADMLHPSVPVTIIEKRRTGPNKVEIVGMNGASTKGRTAILYDDMIDTGGSIIEAAEKIHKEGATRIYICATHGLFSRNAEERFKQLGCQVVVTPTIPRSESYCEQHRSWLTHVSIDDLLAHTIHEASVVGGSVSKLFAPRKKD